MELMELVVTFASQALRILGVYRPPPSVKNRIPESQFHNDFSRLCDNLSLKNTPILLLGDFNIHFDDPTKPCSSKVLKSLNAHSLVQHIKHPTQRHGHSIDWVITRDDTDIIRNLTVHVLDNQMSDHYWIHFDLILKLDTQPCNVTKCRNIRSISRPEFVNDIMSSTLYTNPPSGVNELLELFNTTLCDITNKHAPTVKRKRHKKTKSSWYSDEVKSAKIERRQAECRWRSSKLEIHRQSYNVTRNKFNSLLKQMKSKYFSELIQLQSANPKALFSTMSSLMGKSPDAILPNLNTGNDVLTESFNDFFVDKISLLRNSFVQPASNLNPPGPDNIPKFSCFTPFSENEILKIIKNSKPTWCQLDPVPTKLLLGHIQYLVPIITKVEQCLLSLKTWINNNMLKLNNNKTESLVL
ncbi:hypothetical protein SNE40_010338 [Patella caerulea]|uniref:Endonuclease/exonuclease/phosphatase domain-containing protein n=1 Tax=Patella caerulea TaxID=87958 RepID=A0AAN8JRL3_PATCE